MRNDKAYVTSNLSAERFDDKWPMKKMYENPAIIEAMDEVRKGTPQAEKDTTRPVYHFRPPARWMNDPCGTIYYKDYYHVFYQLNPSGDTWGENNSHWGHTRSKDLVHWEHLPIALWPSRKLGERRCNSGCVVINGRGQPIIFYTYVPLDTGALRQHWAAIGDKEMITWKKHPANPILEMETHGGPIFKGGWSDPFVFQTEGRTFMIVGKCVTEEGRNLMPIYETTDPEFVHWNYRGIMLDTNGECPNFFRLREKWVLLFSPYSEIRYFMGSFDLETLKFKPEKEGILSYGFVNLHSRGFYASNILVDNQGRTVLFGWIGGFESNRGWNGCLSLPRILSIGPDGHLRQRPPPELHELRDKHVRLDTLILNDTAHVIEGTKGDTLEIQVTFEPGNAKSFGIKMWYLDDGKEAATLRYDGQILDVNGTKVPFDLADDEKTFTLGIFIDKSVMEVFVNGGRASITRCIEAAGKDISIELFAEAGSVTVNSCDVWQMKSIW